MLWAASPSHRGVEKVDQTSGRRIGIMNGDGIVKCCIKNQVCGASCLGVCEVGHCYDGCVRIVLKGMARTLRNAVQGHSLLSHSRFSLA